MRLVRRCVSVLSALFLLLHVHGFHSTRQFSARGGERLSMVGSVRVGGMPSMMDTLLRKASSALFPPVERALPHNAVDPAVEVPPMSLPWKASISPSRTLAYMPALENQLDLIRLLGMKCVSMEERFLYRSSGVKPARIGNLCFSCDRFRKVRLTYFDAGESVQVFNALWYPALEYDAPLLGVDLISLGPKRVLSVVDFQPLHPTAEYAAKYIAPMEGTRSKYPDLHGKMSGKFYDDTSFFSSQMLFGRFTDESKVESVVLPSHAEYLQSYVDMVHALSPNSDPKAVEVVRARQTAYDTYSARKDPAVGLFDAYFGQEWSRDFVYEFLFDSAMPPLEKDSPSTHSFSVNAATGVPTITPRR